MSNITVVIPVHEYTETNVSLLKNAISTVPTDYNIIVSVPNGIVADFAENFGDNVNVVSNTQETSFAHLVNAATSSIETKWFSILEFDDEYTDIWFTNVEKYIETEPSTSIFIPLEDIYEFGTKKYIGFGNEAPWASAFSNEIGYLDLDCLQNYFDFYLTGSVFNLDDWNEIGGLKSSIKITFWYEFLLRAANKDKKIFIIPKVGYLHYLNRENSLTNIYKATMSEKETKWWFDLAKKDYFFKTEKDPSYYVYKEKETEPSDEDE